jgi:ABC-type nickel/cobalt efflux system permease component RcnA
VSRRRARRAFLFAIALLAFAPAVALAHPLGNFTINHFAALRIGTDRVSLDVVIDRAEIPAFQERQRLDTDGDGTVSAAEIEAERQVACGTLASQLSLSVGGQAVPLVVQEAGISFPPGAGGLVTMRLVCEYTATPAAALVTGNTVAFSDASFAERIGWREIVVAGDGAMLGATSLTSGSGSAAEPAAATTDLGGVSQRLTVYPTNLLTQPLAERTASTTVSAIGRPALPIWTAPDATPLVAGAGGSGAGSASAVLANVPLGAVPGGVAPELASIIDAGGLQPGVLLLSLLLAVGLGAVHALSPGHGKTIMAAYLVGTRGTARHAVGLGLTVTVSHTLGVLALAGVTLLAADLLPPDRLYPVLGVASGALVIVIGGSLLWSRLRVVLAARAASQAHAHAHAHGHEHDQGDEHAQAGDHAHDQAPEGVHSHGGRAHSHVPPAGTSLSWKSLFALGLSGGLVPSASALILLLGSISAGRLGYGIVLVVAFGAGMALVLAGVGLVLVRASSLVDRLPAGVRRAGAGRTAAVVQMGTAGLVIALGLVLTSQALTTVL